MSQRNTRAPRQVKKGLDADDARRRREELTVELRRNKREEQVQKRRQLGDGQGPMHRDVESAEQAEAQAMQQPMDSEVMEKIQMLPQYTQMLASPDPAQRLHATTEFRKILSIERNPPIDAVIACGVVPIFIQFLQMEAEPKLQFEAAWSLTNIASGTSSHTRLVMDAGAIPIFVILLRSPDEEVREQAVWALGNIAGDSPPCRDLVLNAGVLQNLIPLCTPHSKVTMLRNATWTLSNLCRGKPQPEFALVRDALPTLADLLYSKDEEVLTDACWALSYLSDDTGPNNEKIQAVITSGLVKRLVELLMHRSNNVKTPALRSVGNIVTGDDLQTQVVINCALLPQLLHLLSNNKRSIRKEACWTISNVTAGTDRQIQDVIDANLFPPLIDLLRRAEFDVKKEAAWAISNATSGGNDSQLSYLVDQGCIPPLCELFKSVDGKIITVALEGIENLLKCGRRLQARHNLPSNPFTRLIEACGGLDKLEELQEHESEDVYQKANRLLREYFDASEVQETVQTVAPTATSTGFVFQQQQAPGGGFNF